MLIITISDLRSESQLPNCIPQMEEEVQVNISKIITKPGKALSFSPFICSSYGFLCVSRKVQWISSSHFWYVEYSVSSRMLQIACQNRRVIDLHPLIYVSSLSVKYKCRRIVRLEQAKVCLQEHSVFSRGPKDAYMSSQVRHKDNSFLLLFVSSMKIQSV